MSNLVAFFVDRPLLVNLITVFICVLGAVTALNMTRSLLPAGMPNKISIVAELPGASAIDVEQFVTFRLEEALHGMENIDHLKSVTTNGRTKIQLDVNPKVENLSKIIEESRSRLSAIQYRLPRDLRPLRIEEEALSGRDFMRIVFQGVDEKNYEHRNAVTRFIERIERLPNVLHVSSSMRNRNIYIRFDRTKLNRFGVNITLARQRIFEFLGHWPVGTIQEHDQNIAVEFARHFKDLKTLEKIPLLVNRASRGILLKDVATIEYGFTEELERRVLNGKHYFECSITNADGTDTVDISNKIKAIIANKAKELLPSEISVRVGIDASELVEHEISTLTTNGLGGIAVVLLILMLFLGWRVSAMTALGLPFCYLGILLVLNAFNVNFNLVSLVAMILVVGILVDDAIIISEEFTRLLAQGLSAREAAVCAVLNMAKPVLGMVMTTAIAFMPLLLSKGGESWMLRPLPIVIISALFISLFESFFILPNHLKHLMPKSQHLVKRKFIEKLRIIYEKILKQVLRFRYVSILLFAGLVFLSVILVMGPVPIKMGLHLSGRASIRIELAESTTSLDELHDKIRPIEQLVQGLPSDLVDFYTTKLGWMYTAGHNTVRGWKYALIEVMPPGTFVEQEEKRHRIEKLLKEPLAKLIGPVYKKIMIQDRPDNETRDMITVYVSGGDSIDFDIIQNTMKAQLTKVPNIKDVFMDEARFQKSLRFHVNNARLLSYGLNKQDIHAQIREHFKGQELLRIRQQGEEILVYLEFTNKASADPEQLNKMTVMTAQSVPVPLKYVGKWEATETLRRIEHQDLLRMFQIDVLYDPEKIKAQEVSDAIEKQLEPVRESFPGFHISVKPNEEEEKSKVWVLRILVMCVGLIYLCLALSLNSLIQPIVIIFAIPFGFMGVVLAFYLHGMYIGIMAVIGILGLAGVVVNDSLVMTTTVNSFKKSHPELSTCDAITQGAGQRFCAVILTSLTTLGGVFPLAYGIAGQAGWITPMVLAVGWGLLFATLLTLGFLPCLLMFIEDAKHAFGFVLRRLFHKNMSK